MRKKSISCFRVVLIHQWLLTIVFFLTCHLLNPLELLNMRIEIFFELGYIYSFLIHGIAFPDGYRIVLG